MRLGISQALQRLDSSVFLSASLFSSLASRHSVSDQRVVVDLGLLLKGDRLVQGLSEGAGHPLLPLNVLLEDDLGGKKKKKALPRAFVCFEMNSRMSTQQEYLGN